VDVVGYALGLVLGGGRGMLLGLLLLFNCCGGPRLQLRTV
jgi:hypothetical protein